MDEEQMLEDMDIEVDDEEDYPMLVPQDANEEDAQQEAEEGKYKLDKKSNIPQFMKQFYAKHQQVDPLEYFPIPKAQPVARQVCAKVVNATQLVVECFDCAVDHTCIICLQCFKNGNHEGHKFVVKKAGGGCCDCGDVEAWNPQGFCKHHSGKFKDFQIPGQVQENFNHVMDGIIYCYFYCVLKKSPKAESYTTSVINFLIQLNKQSLYYNKLTALSLNRPLTKDYVLCKEMNSRTILQNILTFRVSRQKIRDWFDLFIMLFPYYPFKNWLVQHFMKNYELLIDGSNEAVQTSNSLACQLLTSHQLIQTYAENNKVGLGELMKLPDDLDELENVMFSLSFDFKYLSDLPGEASGLYWRMHINGDFENFFGYYPILKSKLAAMSPEQLNNQSYIMSKYISFSQIEFRMLGLFPKIVRSIQHFPETMITLIKYLLKKASQEDPSCPLTLFLPYQRALGVTLFAYFQCNLSNITPDQAENLRNRLQLDEQTLAIALNSIFKRLLRTFLIYSKSMVEAGLQSTLYHYLYFYKVKNRLISVIDIVMLKILILFPNVSTGISFLKQVNFDGSVAYSDSQIKKKQAHLNIILKELGLLYTSKSYEIFLAYQINKNCELFVPDIEQMICQILTQNKGSLSIEHFMILKEHMFHREAPVDQIIKKHTKFQKERKVFKSLNPIEGPGINFNDYRINIEKDSSDFQNPQKTASLIYHHNTGIFNKLWNEEGTKNLIKAFLELKNASETKDDPILRGLLSNITKIAEIQNQNVNQNFHLIVKKILDQSQYRQLLPSEYLKKMNLVTLPEEDEQISGEKDNTLKQKRQKAKLEKLKKLKAKTKTFLKTQDVFQDEQSQEEQLMCCICRNKDPSQFVYLGNLAIRNHQKLINIGNGVECAAFSSCPHVFDLTCIQKKFQQNVLESSILCPLCKSSSNILIPVKVNPKNIKLFLERFIQIIFSFKQESDLYEQLIKSIYHFVLLGEIDIKHCFQKNLRTYRVIWNILKQTINENYIKQLFQKFTKFKFSVSTEKKKKIKKKKKKKKSTGYKLIEYFRFGGIQDSQEDSPLQEPGISLPFPRCLSGKEKIQQKEEKSETQQEEQNPYSQLFEKTMFEVFRLLKKENQKLLESENPVIQICLNALIDPQQSAPPASPLTQRNILRELPLRYTPLGTIRKCPSCGEFSLNLMICLLCQWLGCEKCSGGSVLKHTQQNHGKIGAFMYVQKGTAYYLVSNVLVLAGSLYQDELGQSFQIKKDWDKYQLNIPLKEKIEKTLLYDQVALPKKQKNQLPLFMLQE